MGNKVPRIVDCNERGFSVVVRETVIDGVNVSVIIDLTPNYLKRGTLFDRRWRVEPADMEGKMNYKDYLWDAQIMGRRARDGFFGKAMAKKVRDLIKSNKIVTKAEFEGLLNGQ